MLLCHAKMKRIDILVSSSEDVQKERRVAEQSIRWVAAELGVPVRVSCSDQLSEPTQASETGPGSDQEDGLLLCPYFREHQDSMASPEYCEQMLNPGQYDLVIGILWSRLGTRSAPMFVLPDGRQPGSATEYEVAWALDQSKRTPGFPGLRVYRNRATPTAPLEPKEKRESLCRDWDAVQEFCAGWEKNDATEFRECCHGYQDLEEFENLFREHFRDFLARQLDRQIGSTQALPKPRYSESNPFRGLNFFDFEDAALFHGRTKAIWEVLDALKTQATAKKPFVLVLGPTGSGKSSLVRAGVLPLLTQSGTPGGDGLWRRAVTRPGAGGDAGDPFDALAAALLREFALPELQDEESTVEWRSLASRLRKDPDDIAALIPATLDQLNRRESDHLEADDLPARRSEGVEVRQKSKARIRPKVHLALVVDQLEELFSSGFSPVLQRKYICALGALAKCERVFIIATLRSGFYADCQQFPELVELTELSGKYELRPPTPCGIGNIVRFRADAAGLRFERDPGTGRGLDEALVEAAIAIPEPLPLLEHLLSRLYQRQLDRKDGLLLWSDYRGLGELHGALAQHEKTVFSTLKGNEKEALRFVIRCLVEQGQGEEGHLIRRNVPYRDLISSPELNERQRTGAIGLVDRLIKEGLLSAGADPKQGLLISVPQEALLRRWPGVWQWISEDRHFFQMRDRLDASLKRWLAQGHHSDDLLERGIGLAEAATLLRDFGSSLSEGQIEYIQKSLAKQKRRRWVRDGIGLAAVAGLAVFAAFAGIGRFNTKSHHKNKEEVQPAQQNADFVASQRSGLETQLNKAEEKAQLAQQNADLANSQRGALETELKKAREEKTQLAQQNANLTSQSSALETELKKARDAKAQVAQQKTDLATGQTNALEAELEKAREEKTQLAQQNANLTSQSSVLETRLKKAEENARVAQQNTDLTSNQRSALETQLKKAEEKAQLAQQNADLATSQRNDLETELKKAREEKAQLAQQNANLTSQSSALESDLKKAGEDKTQLAQQNANLTSQSSALGTQLKKAEENAQVAQQNTDLANNQRSGLETELKKTREEKTQIAQQNADLTSQSRVLGAQLKKAEEKAQLAQQNADLATSLWSALETQLKKEKEKAQLAQRNTDLATSQRSALETQLKKAQEEAQLAQRNADLASSQRSALETQLKKAQEEKALAQQNADLATSQRSALETQLKKAQEDTRQAQKHADLAANQLKSGQTQPLNPGQNSESVTSP
jgi:conflict system STAND superfamily ATPase